MPRRSTVHAVTVIGVDLGKNTLHLVGLNSFGAIVLREKVSRGRITLRLANLPPCLIGIEAGMATHYGPRPDIRSSESNSHWWIARQALESHKINWRRSRNEVHHDV